jgi:predicted lactoylglutathione lyase
MGLELYMVGVIVEEMARALEFYRRLGVDIPEGAEKQQHVEIKMSGMTFFITTKKLNARWDPARTEASGGYRMILEFYLKTREALDAKYAEMMCYGYESHVAPYVTPFKMYFAMINDPDGNTILLSAETGDAPATA